VIGLGNVLAGDDAVGPAAVAELRSRALPRHLRLDDAHGDPLCLVDSWRGETHVWLVDAVEAHATPGTVHCLDHDDLLRVRQRHRDAHALSMSELLGWLVIGSPALRNARFGLWGVEPASIVPGNAVDPRVRAGVTRMVDRLLAAAIAVPVHRD